MAFCLAVGSSNICDQVSGSPVLSWPLLGYPKRRLGIRRRLQQMPSCYLRTASAMRQGRSCGKVNTSLGERVTVTNTAADAVSSNHIPWIIIGICYVSCMILLLAIRVVLASENKLRDAEPPDDTFNDVYVVTTDEGGNRTEVKVPKVRVCSVWQLICSCNAADRSF
jgi:hypothetical protein